MQEQTEPSIFEEDLSPGIQHAVTSIGKWGKLISIIGFSIGAFMVVIFLVAGAAMFKAFEQAMPVQGLYSGLVIMFFILFFIAAAVLYFLYKGSTLLQRGIQQRNNTLIAEGFSYLKRFFLVSAIVSGLGLLVNLFSFFI